MHPRQAQLITKTREVTSQLSSLPSKKGAAIVLWKYTDPEGLNFYLEERRTTVRSPFSGKSFTTKPTKLTPSQVGAEMKAEMKDDGQELV